MRVLVTGGAGFLGAVLVRDLLAAGHEVTILDRFFFGEQSVNSAEPHENLRLVRDDTRWCGGEVLEGHDAVVDMAALSNDPSGAINPWKTYEINYLGRSRIARLALKAGIARYVATSSCSIYGFQPGILDEGAEPRPLTAYAEANVRIERDTLPLNGRGFTVTALRLATLYGVSERMRFDLAINGMVLGAFRSGAIPVMREGSQWRPFLHVRDASLAIRTVLSASPGEVGGQVFNVGSDDQNYQIAQLANEVSTALSRPNSLEWYGDADTRSYRVSFRKVRGVLGFDPGLRPRDAVREIERGLLEGRIEVSPRSKTLDWYQVLLGDSEDRHGVRLHGTVL